MSIARTRLGLVFALSVWTPIANADDNFGSFQGDLVVKALPDGRNLELTRPFSYVDPDGKHWAVPAGTIVDGASIPQPFWSIIGGPFEDKYREASVIHDYYCVAQTDTWEKVHLTFYNGMRARGVGGTKAKIMNAAVYNFGPRWLALKPENPSTRISGRPLFLDRAKETIIKFISDNDPSIAAIQEMSDKLSQVESIEQLEALLNEHANCTPILTDQGDVKRTLVLCQLDQAAKKLAAIKNLKALALQLRQLLHTQKAFMVPTIEEYVEAPSPEKWEAVKSWSRDVYGLVKIAMRSVLDLDDPQAQAKASTLDGVFAVLSTRAAMISPILEGPPKSKSEMQGWITRYRVLVERLESKVAELDAFLSGNSP
jgi:hypothetical protein